MNKNLFAMAALALCMGFTSCDDDDDFPVSVGTVTNAELKAVLENEGIEFDEAGHIVMNDKANNLKTLDLTGKKLKEYAELAFFPNLTELDLSNNDFGPEFDFTILPPQIKAIDLTGNEIKEFKNLVKVEIAENGDETITNLRNLVKLHLPDEAAENTTDLVRYYRQNKEAIEKGELDLQMEDESGKLSKYTTLRTIKDPVFAAYLKKQYSSIFTGDQLDLGKHLSNEEKINDIILNPYMEIENFDKLANLEGLQYILSNPYWEGTTITIQYTGLELPEIKVPSTVTLVHIVNAKAPKGIDLTKASTLQQLYLEDVSGIESVDLSASKVWGQRDIEADETSSYPTTLQLLACRNLKTITFPVAKTLRASWLDIECLDALETLDLSNFTYIKEFSVGDLPASYKLSFPNITEFPGPNPPFRGRFAFGCSRKTLDLPQTQEFINKYSAYDGAKKIKGGSLYYFSTNPGENTQARW